MSYRAYSLDHNSKRYSPSRQASQSPPPRMANPLPRRPDSNLHRPQYEYSPPPRRSPSPPRQRYERYEWSPPRDVPPPRRYSPERTSRHRSRSPTRPVDSYRPVATVQPIKADPSKWERGVEVEESPRNGPSQPMKDVIFIGLDDELDENDLIGYLRSEHRAMVDAVKIVRKRFADTGRKNNLAFVTFSSLAGAEDFIDNNYPSIVMPALYSRSDSKKVKVDFAAPAPIINHIPIQSARLPHDGMRDVGPMGNGNRVLLLRQLDAGSRAELVIKRLSEEIAKFCSQPGRDDLAAQTILRVVMIADRESGQGWGICFIELVTTELANALLPYLISPVSQPSGFRISGIPVAVSFASTSSFVPAANGIHCASHGGIGSSLTGSGYCSYWHQQGTVIETIPRNNTGEGLTSQLRDFLGPLAGPPPAPVTSHVAINPGLLAPGASMAPIRIGAKKIEEPMMINLSAKNILLEEEPTEEKDTQLVSRTKGTNIVLPQSGRKVAKNINKWNTKQTELAKPVKSAPKVSTVNSITIAPQPVPLVDYADISTLASTGKVACLLCQRQFNSEDILRKHVAQSDLHKTNLLNPDVVTAGKQRIATAATEYRDRAAERRKAFNQPEKPGWIQLHPDKKRKYADAPPTPAVPEPGVEPGQDETNVGNQLLAKMGWKSGTGLGQEGAGRVEPIKVQQFAERAGLGASQGHSAGSWTGAGGRAQQAHDVSQARYKAADDRR